MASTVAAYVVAGALWGCTNPLIKLGQDSVWYAQHCICFFSFDPWLYSADPKYETAGPVMKYLDSRILVPFAINQCGSLVFYYVLSEQPLSIAVPSVNALTFFFTAITSLFVTRERPKNALMAFVGVVCVIVGIGLMISSQR